MGCVGLGCLVLNTHSASLDVVGNVGIYVRPIDGHFGEELHLSGALVAVIEIC